MLQAVRKNRPKGKIKEECGNCTFDVASTCFTPLYDQVVPQPL